MKTFSTYEEAKEYAHVVNQTRQDKKNPMVVVHGPGDNEGSAMKLTEAIENEFSYEWD